MSRSETHQPATVGICYVAASPFAELNALRKLA